jgi:hypothetical protein
MVFGAVELFAGTSGVAQGVLTIALGAASLAIREPPMLMLIAGWLGWAAVVNLLSGNWLWMGLALLQVYWAVKRVREFRRLQAAAAAEPGALESGRAPRVFPFLALGLGAVSILGFVAAFVLAVLRVPTLRAVSLNLFTGAWMLGAAAMAAGVASWLSRHPHRWASVIGIGLGLLTTALFLLVLLVGRLLH